MSQGANSVYRGAEYMLAHNFNTLSKDDEFIEWPQHATIVPWMVSLVSEHDFVAQIMSVRYSPFLTEVDTTRDFGVEVSLLTNILAWRGLQAEVLGALDGLSKSVAPRLHVGDQFNPHITHKDYLVPPTYGDRFWIDEFDIVKRVAGNQTKTILESVRFA